MPKRFDQLHSPFDAAATTYDADFSYTRLGRWMREAVWQQIGSLFQPGNRILDLGCGTGEDALWLARRGIAVTALDASVAMLDVARQKLANQAVAGFVQFIQADLCALGSPTHQYEYRHIEQRCYDGALANFGALNCMPDRRLLACWLARLVKPGGKIALVLMGPVCAWEIGWHLLHGDLWQAMRRLNAGRVAHTGGGGSIPVWFPSMQRLSAEFAPFFRPTGQYAIGGILPPPYLEQLVTRFPQLFTTMALLDRRMAQTWPWPLISDHYLVIFERVHDDQ